MSGHDTAVRRDDPQLDVVVVSAAGARDLLRACLRSLERHPPSEVTYRAWLVDNASGDGTVEMVEREFPWVHVVALSTNLGFGSANNVVLRQAGAPQALLLNPDTELTEGAIDRALLTLRERSDAAVVGVRLVRLDGSFDHAAKRSFPTLLGALGEFTGIGRFTIASGRLGQYRAPTVPEDGRGEVDAVNGAFMLIRRKAIEQVGLFDERYGMYGEDLDWCYRFKRAGWSVIYDGSVSVLHVKGAMSVIDTRGGRHRALVQNIAFHRAMGRFYRKFHGGSNTALDALVYMALGFKTAISVARSAFARRGQRT